MAADDRLERGREVEELLGAYDRQVRRDAAPGAGSVLERDGSVVRVLADGDGWSGVCWSALDEHTADAAIAAQIECFSARPGEWEWKHYAHDTPADLPARLLRAGFRAEEHEAVLVMETAALTGAVEGMVLPEGVELTVVNDRATARLMMDLQERVFGKGGGPGLAELMAGISARPQSTVALMATADGIAVAAGRIEFSADTEFAGLWGGCTLPEWEGRGIFRALLAHAAGLAAERGVRYLQADASSESRPILERLGFVRLTTTTPYIHPGAAPRG